MWLVPALRLARRRDGLPEAPGSGEPGTPLEEPAGCRSTRHEAEQLAVVQGWADTRATLRRWQQPPVAASCCPWALGSARRGRPAAGRHLAGRHQLSTPDPTGAYFPGRSRPADAGDFGFVLYRNGLVLALHAMACVAGFMAGSSLPQAAKDYTGVWRAHPRAGRPARDRLRRSPRRCSRSAPRPTRSATAPRRSPTQLGVSPLVLIVGLLPHALPELFALFLPLAAWTLASRARPLGRAAGRHVRHRRRRRARSCSSPRWSRRPGLAARCCSRSPTASEAAPHPA